MKLTKKMIGDSGEHYALAMFAFSGILCLKMPDGWRDYDILVEEGGVLKKVSVKTRSRTEKLSHNSWFSLRANSSIDWLVCVLILSPSEVNSWIIPVDVVKEKVKISGKSSEFHLTIKMIREEFSEYENNWTLKRAMK